MPVGSLAVAVADLAILLAWLGAVIFQARRWVYYILGIAAFAAIGCHLTRPSPSYPPPAQIDSRFSTSVEFSERYHQTDEPRGTYIRDVLALNENGSHWTHEHPTVQFYPGDATHWSFVVHFETVGVILNGTGPQTIRFSINGVLLDEKVYDQVRTYKLRYEINPAWIKPRSANTAVMDIQPGYTVSDGRLGVLLYSMGFVDPSEQ